MRASNPFVEVPPRHKDLIREEVFALRDAITEEERSAGAERLAAQAALLLISRGATVAGFIPIRSEIDARPLMRALAAGGCRLALPVVDRPLRFRLWDGDDASLAPAGQGTRGPPPDAPEVVPEVLLVPLAAFDRAGYRVGYGRAHYDSTIAHLTANGRRPLLVGVGFAVQEIAKVPVEPHDEPVDLILTERELISMAGAT